MIVLIIFEKCSKPFQVLKKYAAATKQLADDIYIFLILLKPCILKSCKKSLRQGGKVDTLPEPVPSNRHGGIKPVVDVLFVYDQNEQTENHDQ